MHIMIAYLFKCCFEESGIVSPKITGVEFFCVRVLARQHASPNRAITHNPNAKLTANWNQVFLQAVANSAEIPFPRHHNCIPGLLLPL